MFIDQRRTEARMKILVAYNQGRNIDAAAQDIVLHAAAKIKVPPLNTMQLIKDYPNLVRQTNPEGPICSICRGKWPL